MRPIDVLIPLMLLADFHLIASNDNFHVTAYFVLAMLAAAASCLAADEAHQ